MDGEGKSNDCDGANGEMRLKSDKPVYCSDCSVQCKGGARRKNCLACAAQTISKINSSSLVPSPPWPSSASTANNDCSSHPPSLESHQVGTPGFRDLKEQISSYGFYDSSKLKNGKSHIPDSDSSDDSDEADNCCFYTYKGIDPGVNCDDKLSDRSAQRSSSSEMDYLEMDFDPGTSNGHDCSDDSGHSASHSCPDDPCLACPGPCCRPTLPLASSVQVPAVTPPELDSENEAGGECCQNVFSTERLSLAINAESLACPPFTGACRFELLLDDISCVSTEGDTLHHKDLDCQLFTKVKISDQNALQGNPSAQLVSYINQHLDCYNITDFIGDMNDPLNNAEVYSVRDGSREDSRLVDFLIHFASPVPTFSDLLNDCGCDTFFSRWFSTFPPRNFQLCKFLLHWLHRGAVPIISFSDNYADWQDSWKSMIVVAASATSIAFGAKPTELVHEDVVMKKLSSPATLRIGRKKILSLWSPLSNLSYLQTIDEWKEHNVLGQIVFLIREIMWKDVSSKSILVPSKFQPGITLVIESSSPFLSELKSFPELPSS